MKKGIAGIIVVVVICTSCSGTGTGYRPLYEEIEPESKQYTQKQAQEFEAELGNAESENDELKDRIYDLESEVYDLSKELDWYKRTVEEYEVLYGELPVE